MRRSLVAVFTLISLAMAYVSPARAEDEWSVLVLFDTPPFSYREEGVLKGFNVEVAQELCKRMKVRCRLGEGTLSDILDEVAAGRAQIGMANLLMTEERAARVLFSVPLWRSSSSFVARRGTDLPKNEARIAVVAGSVQEAYLRRVFPSARILDVASTSASLRLVQQGQADYTLLPIAVASEIVRRSDDLIFTGERLQAGALGGTVHLIVPPGRHDLKARVDKAIRSIIDDGFYLRVSRTYFPIDLH